MVRGRRPAALGRRALLVPVLAALVAILGALLFSTAPFPGLSRSGPGGYLGLSAGQALYRGLGRAAGLSVLFGSVVVLRLLVDVRLYAMLRSWLGRPGAAGGGTAVLDEPAEADLDDEPAEDEEDADPDDPEAPSAGPERPPKRPRRRPPAPARDERPSGPPRKLVPSDYVFPPLALLEPGVATDSALVREEVAENGRRLGETLASFGVEARVVSSLRGPVITFYEIEIPTGVRLNRVTALADDLAIALKAPSIRIVAPIPGKSTIGVEVPNLQRDPVVMHDLVRDAAATTDRKAIPIFLGRDTAGRPMTEDLASMPHILIAGATGSGKSVCINSILLSVLYTRSPAELRLILIDPKQVELSFFEGIPHLLTPVVTDMKRAAKILEWAVGRMEQRYDALLAAGVRNIAGYNALPQAKRDEIRERTAMTAEDFPDHMPYLVIVVDELADLMLTSGKEVEIAITRLAQKSRAVGIHIILATQRPSTNVITGLIKANMPTRISFVVASKVDSRVVLDANGADKLLGTGDMLYMNPRSLHLKRAQGTLVTDAEARAVVDFLKEKHPQPVYENLLARKTGELGDPMEEDDLYNDAVRAVLATRLGSASMLQRRLGIGYTRASRLIDMMCERQIVGPHVGSKAREVFLTLEDWDAEHPPADGSATDFGTPPDPTDPDPVDTSWE
jgi:S-DNA-T family DNA segregation ATPase FtsK/SpoIIIE